MVMEIHDVIILGGGPAGLTAGIYTARHGLRTLLIERQQLGGRAWGPHWIENFPGFPEGITGSDLMDRFIAQTRKFGVEFKEETVVGLKDLGGTKIVTTRGGFYQARVVVITTGRQRQKLSIPGEEDFKGRGVCYCAICDGPFFKDQVVAVIGSGKDAIEDAIRLAEIASKVYAIPGSKGYKEGVEDLEKLSEYENIEVIEGLDIESIEGNDLVTNINLKGETLRSLDVSGVFMVLDTVSTADLMKDAGIETDEVGCIKVDRHQMTNIKGIYAAGDSVCSGTQIVTAAGDGGRAALAILRYVRSLKR
jgi:thioredoxin reductase (NADPH)